MLKSLNYLKTVKYLYLILFFLSSVSLYSMKKPELKFGINSKINLKDYNLHLLEQDYSTDKIYYSVKEDISSFFSIILKTEFISYNYNKNVNYINELNKYKLNSLIQLNLKIMKILTLRLYSRPCIDFNQNNKEYTFDNKIQFILNIKNFKLSTYYANSIPLAENNKIIHYYYLSFYWSFPKINFLKFKLSFFYYLQYFNNDKIIINPVKKGSINFEIIIDFNKLSFDELFDKKDDDFFDE